MRRSPSYRVKASRRGAPERTSGGLAMLLAVSLGVGAMTTPGVARAIAGIEGTFEYAIDAPWRIEPSFGPSGELEYGAIPIQISFHDEPWIGLDPQGKEVFPPAGLGDFCDVSVIERLPSGIRRFRYSFEDLAEVEFSRPVWGARPDFEPTHEVCRRWRGQDCSSFKGIDGSSEWHALLWHEPSVEAVSAGDLSLEVHVTVSRDATNCGEGDRVPLSFINELRVALPESPLPRFSSHWIYGDLHYHSQGTDNEGESAYNYRGVVRAMGAMGLDFVFATEHASDSLQIVDGDVFVNSDLDLVVRSTTIGLRDMNANRFKFNHAILHGNAGVNREAARVADSGGSPQSVLSSGVVPQIYLGGEVDLIPEVAPGVGPTSFLPWGNLQRWGVFNLCGGWGDLERYTGPCPLSDFFVDVADPPATLIKDAQGPNDTDFARHHIVYLPRLAADRKAFVASRTGEYGGASQRLRDLLPDLEMHGYFFLAHPMSHPEPGGLGPDDVPWTDHLFEQAWRSIAALGLQFWNEDTRLREEILPWSREEVSLPDSEDERREIASYCFDAPFAIYCPVPGAEVGYERLDELPIPGQSPPPATLASDFPRNGFREGSFHLAALAPVTGSWPSFSIGIAASLYHGAFTWDRLNHWGVDAELKRSIPWLTIVEPRRMLMAGGSDAHGDLNYRREGYLIRTTRITDTAIGKPRNLVEVGEPRGVGETPPAHTQDQVADAIAAGRFTVTDGPAVRIAVDRNGNGTIDADDIPMGGVAPLEVGEGLPLLVGWASTPEFGPVERVDVYVGARSSARDLESSTHEIGRTYAPEDHGPEHPGTKELGGALTVGAYERMADWYWKDPTQQLAFEPSGAGLGGTRRIDLDLGALLAEGNVPADHFFVRAFARTGFLNPDCASNEDVEARVAAQQRGLCSARYAFTNPIWAIDTSYVCSADAGLDTDAPTADCNAPLTLEPPDQPVSFTATARDVCDASAVVSSPVCFSFTKKGKRVERDCVVTTEGDTVTLVDGGGVASHVRWQLTVSDEAGNSSRTACELQLIRPSK